MADKQQVITIGRETGSGGHQIGQMLAERLGIRYYDKELLALAAKESGIVQDLFENYDEKPVGSFLFSTVMNTYSLGAGVGGTEQLPINHRVFLAQFDTIKKVAEDHSCVIIGRCADYALSDNPHMVSVFITADKEDKVKRIAERDGISEDKAADLIAKSDKKRANYYNYFTSKTWGSASSYDLILNSSRIGYDGCVEIILEYLRQKRLKEEK